MFKNLICGLCAVATFSVNAMDNRGIGTIMENNSEFLKPVFMIGQISSIDKTFRKFVDDPCENTLKSFCLGLKYAKNTFANNNKLKHIYMISKNITEQDVEWLDMGQVAIDITCLNDFLTSFNDKDHDNDHIQEIYVGKHYRISYTPHFCNSGPCGYLRILIKRIM